MTPIQERPTTWSVPVPYARRGDPEDPLTSGPSADWYMMEHG